MKPDLVADVGNSRIKWGRCSAVGVTDSVSLPPDDPAAWQEQLQHWEVAAPGVWVITGVHPPRRERLASWLRQRGHTVQVLDGWRQLPLRVRLEHPERAGIDRLLNAVAANSRRPPGKPAVLVDAGTAVTVDWLDEDGAFAGGSIFPGLHLMAQSLHQYTALLPLIESPRAVPALPGTSTRAALEAGIFWAVAGGIRAIIGELSARARTTPEVFLTGGNGLILSSTLERGIHLWPQMTLEGVRLATESLP